MDRETFESKLKDLLNPIQELYKQFLASNPDKEMTNLSMFVFMDNYSAFVLNEKERNNFGSDNFYYADITVHNGTEEN